MEQVHSHTSNPTFDLIDPYMAAELIVKSGDVVLDAGVVRVKGMRDIAALVSDFKEARPYMTKADFAAPTSAVNTDSGPAQVPLERLFGRGSSSQLANELAKRNVGEYRRLKALAQRRGLI